MKKREDNSSLVFTVDVKANKHQIKKAMKKLYGIDVAKVSALIRPDREKKLLSSEVSATKSNLPMLSTTGCPQEGEMGKMIQEECLPVVSPRYPAKLYCCCGVIAVLTVAVVALSVAITVRKTEQISIKNTYGVCPGNWIGFGKKCFHFSEYSRNWTSSQTFCMAQGAQLARFDNVEELNFLARYKGFFDHWIGLQRESSEQPWRWTDNTEYNNLIPIHGDEKYGFLSDRISSSRDYLNRKWICSKPSSNTS
ncbi:C-type lectin domain family 2 member D11-like [Apodemus sylvaticus]|uniref:C-type lectin domain family 2 member D11-like n=1 Tax=Apodemus sylvaticus TaxID=10129 RepID=UPI0022444CE8|nr:C-type lectin domain family 2 member D11-like [Apodemus sylvaticus]